MAEKPKTNNSQKNQQKKQPTKKNPYFIYFVIIAALLGIFFFNRGADVTEITWHEFEQDIYLKGHVDQIQVVNKEFAEVFIKEEFLDEKIHKEKYEVNTQGLNNSPNPGPHYMLPVVTMEGFEKRIQLLQDSLFMLIQSDPSLSAEEKQQKINDSYVAIKPVDRTNWSDTLSFILPILIIVAIWIFFMRMMSRGGAGGGQIFNIGKSKAQLFDRDTEVTINFNDVAGLDEAKVEIMEIVDFLKNPKKYTELGGKIPKGALLVGPPGTGKTLLAKAVAGEARVPFFSMSGSDFVEMFVGVGASRVRDLFKQAKEKAPCIIFIDEIDAIGRARGKNPMTGANDERENTLNQLLTEMDGFASNAGVIILAATNRADILDRALLRAGRFDRQIHVELPDLKEREAIFAVHMKPLKNLDKEVDRAFLAKQTPGFSGADIANVCNEAALIAARKDKNRIERQDFLDAIDRIIGGLEKRSKIISKREKKVIAHHEAGHATVSWLTEHASPLVKVTIIPRGKALGAAWYLPEERQITTFNQMFDEITAALGGRASEEIMFGEVSTGALNDLEKVTKQAHAMVVYFGLNQKIGNISYYDSSGQQEYMFTKPYSEKTAEKIDDEIRSLIEKAYLRAKSILSENKEKLIQLASVLLDKEVIFKEDVELIFGKRPFLKTEEDESDDDKEKKDDQIVEPATETNNQNSSADEREHRQRENPEEREKRTDK